MAYISFGPIEITSAWPLSALFHPLYIIFISPIHLYVTGREEESVHFHLVVSSYASPSAMLTLTPQIGFGSAEKRGRREERIVKE